MDNIKINPAKGSLPALQWCLLEQLAVDESYQRGIEESGSQSLIRRIARDWDWRLCQPLVVARRNDGALYVVDGQHRLTAARARGDIGQLPCVITQYSSAEEEAASFVALNRERRALGQLAVFRAALASGDPQAVTFARIMDATGLKLSRSSNNHRLPAATVSCIGGLRAVLRDYGEKISRIAMQSLLAAWPGERLRFAGSIYHGLGIALHERKASLDETLVMAVLGGGTQEEWRDEIARFKGANPNLQWQQAAAAVIGKAYDEAAAD